MAAPSSPTTLSLDDALRRSHYAYRYVGDLRPTNTSPGMSADAATHFADVVADARTSPTNGADEIEGRAIN